MVAVEVAASQLTSTVLPTAELCPRGSAGREALTPSHISAGSQAAAEALHTTPGLPGVWLQPDTALQESTGQAPASSQLSAAPVQVCTPPGSVSANESTQ